MTTRTPTRPAVRPHVGRPSVPSSDAVHAFDLFDALKVFFRSDAALARALGWQPNTVAAWSDRQVLRPRVEHRRAVDRLLVLMRRASEWTTEKYLAGDWALERQALLADLSPSMVLRVLRETGLRILLGAFVKIAPRTPVGQLNLPSAEDLAAALRQTLGGEALVMFEEAGKAPQVAVDLSDFDD